MTGLITMDDLTNEEILDILDDAERLLPVAKGELYLPLLQGRIMGNLFFEPSTRTRMSFETAMPENIFVAVFIDLWPCLFNTELC